MYSLHALNENGSEFRITATDYYSLFFELKAYAVERLFIIIIELGYHNEYSTMFDLNDEN